MSKVKITITIDADALEKAKADAERNDRTLSGHINRLIKEYQCVEQAGISPDALQQIIQALQGAKKTAARPGRPRKPGTVVVQPQGQADRYLILRNKRRKKMLITDAPAYYKAADYITEALENGTFEQEEVQRDFSEECDNFEVFGAIGESVEKVKEIYRHLGGFYDDWLDLSYLGSAEKPAENTVQTEPDPEPQKPAKTRKATMKQAMAIEWDFVSNADAKKEFNRIKSCEKVRKAAEDYMAQNWPDGLKPGIDGLSASDILNIMQELQQDYYAEQRGEEQD